MQAATAAASRFGSALERAAALLTGRPLFWAVLVAALAAWPLLWSLRAPLPPPLPVLGRLPAFRLVDEQGRPFGSEELRGSAWAASFLFTRCPTVCPALARQLEKVQARTRQLQPAFRLVTVTVDPEHDTPEVLRAYARAHRALPGVWSFLSGPPAEVRRLVGRGFGVALGREPGPDGQEQIFHGTQLVLVDGEGRLRGTYDGEDQASLDRLVRDAALLVNRGR